MPSGSSLPPTASGSISRCGSWQGIFPRALVRDLLEREVSVWSVLRLRAQRLPPPRVNMLRGPLSEERAEALGRSGWQVLGGNDPVPLCMQKTI